MPKIPLVTKLPSMVAGMAIYDYDPHLYGRFCVEDRMGEQHILAHRVGDSLHVPRAACPPPTKDTDRRIIGAPIDVASHVKPRNKEQKRVIKEAMGLLLDGESFITQASTGFGKTVITMPLIAAVGRKTLIIVPKEDLIVSWYKALQEFLDLRRSEIGLIQGDTYNVDGKKVVLGMLKSLAMSQHKYPSSMAREFGFVVYDEVHRNPAKEMSKASGLFHAKLRMGLSATPERADGMECLNEVHIGPVQVVAQLLPMVPEVVMWPTAWECPKWNKGGESKKATHSPGKMGHIVKHMGNDTARSKLAAAFAKRAYDGKRNCVVFSDGLEHLKKLKFLTIESGVPASACADYVGGMSEKQREEASTKRLIFATYKMMSEGTNIPWLDACILATPRSNVEQIVGRVCREHPGKPTPVVIDLVDLDSWVCKKFARNRRALYQKMGAEVDQRVSLGDEETE